MTRKKRLRRDERVARKWAERRTPHNPVLRATHEYRAQQQAKVGKEPHREPIESLVSRAFRHLQQFFPDLKKHQLVSEFRRRGFSYDTKWDDPLSHSLMLDLQKKIEAACIALGYQLRDGVSIGILRAESTEAMQQPVMLTETSVIMMTENLQMLIHRTAKLLALTVPFKVVDGDQFEISEDIADAVALANSNAQLREDWAKLFIDYAVSPGTPYRGEAVIVTGKERQTIWEDIGGAMSLFVVGHEYAHHILKHSLSGSASVSGPDINASHRMEVEADILGLMLSMRAGHDEAIPNIFASFGVGAAVVLTVIEYCRHATQVLACGEVKNESRTTHPALADRLECIAQIVPELLRPHGPDQTSVVRRIHGMFVGIIHNAWNSAKEALLLAHQQGTRPAYRDDGGWLPGRSISPSLVSDDPVNNARDNTLNDHNRVII
ncbi:hypothetical protein [Burkholderia territorii]|uniref:hypothetical protein n=1 Tax=Burkholderia territorii TaxID=1503055 RepID=UPI0012DA188C|nr:hypothetical protein [Burkholderia territorii]